MLIDLSQAIYDGMPVYEGDPQVKVSKVRSREIHGWELRELSLGSHTGTHMDAPIHMHDGAATLDEIPLNKCYGPAKLVSAADEAFPRGCGLLFEGAVTLSELERILAVNPPFVGGDISEELESKLLLAGIITFTNLVNLDQLRGKEFIFAGFPLKIKQGDGSPVRTVAIVP